MNNLLNSLGGSLTLTMGKYPQKVAIINYGGPKFTYEEFNERVNRLANALIELGIRKGDKVSYLFLIPISFWKPITQWRKRER
jgi:non-ribosomal peptide synthetase component E (peptide arylation enzyme)